MAKHLKLGADPSVAGWTLPDHADVEKIRSELAAAMEEEDAVAIEVVVGGRGETAELIVNGAALEAALVWEDAPMSGGMTIID